jgi:pimeloyl-ACP methyl ester carboxylesterase
MLAGFATGVPRASISLFGHSRAQMATPPLTEADLRRLSVPALILHGTADPIFPPEHARWAAEKIPGSQLVMVDGMGQAFDPAFFAYVADTLTGFFSRNGEKEAQVK